LQFFVSESRNVTNIQQRESRGQRDHRKKHFVGFTHEAETRLAAASTPLLWDT
jgi:hypothetical protein